MFGKRYFVEMARIENRKVMALFKAGRPDLAFACKVKRKFLIELARGY